MAKQQGYLQKTCNKKAFGNKFVIALSLRASRLTNTKLQNYIYFL